MIKNKSMRSLLGIILIIPFLVFGYHVNHKNYLQQITIEQEVIEHPEKLPNSDMAKISSFWFTNIMADMYWLKSVQYIGENVIGGEYKKYLWVIINLITDLNPYFESPYVIWQLLLPSDETDFDESFNQEEMLRNIEVWRDLWRKWVENFCDPKKLAAINAQDNLGLIINDESWIYMNPCDSYKIPFYLAYIYYYYLDDGANSAKYYKIVSAQKEAPEWARILAAIMQGKWGEREKSLYMFLSLAKNVWDETESCTILSGELENVYTEINARGLKLTGELIANIEAISKQVLPVLSEENENEILDDTKCNNYLAKAIREINLMYLEEANIRYIAEHPTGEPAKNADVLYETGYISFLPTDYQQYPEDGYGIEYEYNSDIGRFDYDIEIYE